MSLKVALGELHCWRSAAGARALAGTLPAFCKLYAVPVRVADEEDSGSAAHRVRLALEVHATSLLESGRQSVEVLDGERHMTITFA